MSDLHLDHAGSGGTPPLAPGVDMVLVAGDTCEGLVKAVEHLRRAYPGPTEVVMVAGNHELWSKHLDFEDHWEMGHAAAERHGVHLPDNSVVTVKGVRLLGCTLWTDYELFEIRMREVAMRTAADTMLDHRRIKWSRNPWHRFRPTEARILHHQSRSFLETELARPHDGPTVCISHHAMMLEAVAPAFRDSVVAAAYASDMTPMIDTPPAQPNRDGSHPLRHGPHAGPHAPPQQSRRLLWRESVDFNPACIVNLSNSVDAERKLPAKSA